MYTARYQRLGPDSRIEVCTLTHAGPLPAPWLATGYVVNLVLDGGADLRSGRGTYLVRPGDLVLANPGQLRAVTRRHTKAATTRSLTVDETYMREALRSRGLAGRPGYFEQATSTNPGLGSAVRALYFALSPLEARLTLESAEECLFDELFRVMVKSESTRWPAHPAVRRAREYIESNSERDLGLCELSAVAGLSRAHFVREFRRQVGVPPHQYQIHIRVRHARALLSRGMPVAAVAAETGFFDQAHFARHFRRLVGVSAQIYRGASGLS